MNTHVECQVISGVLMASVLREKVSEPECAPIQTEVLAHAPKTLHRIVLDLSQVGLISSAGLGMIITLDKECKKHKGKLVLSGLSEELRKIFEVTRLLKLFATAPDREAAARACAS